MIKINLLPPEEAQKGTKKKLVILGAAAGAAVIAIAIIFFFVRVTYERSLSSKLGALQAELKKYQEVVDEVQKLKATAAVLEARKKLIEQLMQNRIAYPRFMENFLKILPPTIWITSLSTKTEGDGLSLSIGCMAFDNFGIADFISNIESSGNFRNITLGTITTGKQGEFDTLTFQITCKYFF